MIITVTSDNSINGCHKDNCDSNNNNDADSDDKDDNNLILR